jgi:deoxyribodipyrimidine photo-lyase
MQRWPPGTRCDLAKLPIDHGVPPATLRGGTLAARERLAWFAARALARYPEDGRQPELDATSRLSPYLHFGHLSAHEVYARVAKRRGAAAFLDQLVTWRELGFNYCAKRPAEYDRYESLPHWARTTLAEHATDPRAHLYAIQDLESRRTHDAVWNAAQGQLLEEGWFHNSMRMLWGKKILEWSRTPQEALQAMVHLMNRHSLDGRDPNSYSGIFWVLGRYDRAWGPERPIFGKVRYMSSESAARKLRLKRYVERYAPGSGLLAPAADASR